MNLTKGLLAAVIIAAALLAGGCGRSGGRGSLKPGADCVVSFRRNMIGIATAVSLDTEVLQGQRIALPGKFVRMDGEWLVIRTEEGLEDWIPREVILHVAVTQ